MDYQNKVNWGVIQSLPELKELAFDQLVAELVKIPNFANNPSSMSLVQYFKPDRHKDGTCELLLVHLVGSLIAEKKILMDELYKALTTQRTVYLLPNGTRLEQKDENPSIDSLPNSLDDQT